MWPFDRLGAPIGKVVVTSGRPPGGMLLCGGLLALGAQSRADLLLALVVFVAVHCATADGFCLSAATDHSARDSTAATNNHDNRQQATNSTNVTATSDRDVTNLHLISDFRAVKLRWSFEHSDKNKPVSFDVRFCELTSWNIEIKCRHRELPVVSGTDEAAAASGGSNPVIRAAADSVRQLEPPNGPQFEAQVYDLRALTNYTFQVQVARFGHELHSTLIQAGGSARRQRSQAARRSDSPDSEPSDRQLRPSPPEVAAARVETKAFGAEATKCLADVSEVLVNTGRYFGGRISVEDSQDPRCHLLGNKSSEQSSYLFRIDHEACRSKIVDGNHIETMVLVHENKDILTHNTARFLVLCNFLQRSFTLRASVSLPKVNALIPGAAGARHPAVITSLPARPTAHDNEDQSHVMLGSMPGVYRAHGSSSASRAVNESSDLLVAANTIHTDSMERAKDANSSLAQAAKQTQANPLEQAAARQPKRLGGHLFQQQTAAIAGSSQQQQRQQHSNQRSGWPIDGSRARSLALVSGSDDQQAATATGLVPEPVQVQSKVLYVERAEPSGLAARGSRRYEGLASVSQESQAQQQQQQTTANLVERSSQIDTPQWTRMPTTTALHSSPSPFFPLAQHPARGAALHSAAHPPSAYLAQQNSSLNSADNNEGEMQKQSDAKQQQAASSPVPAQPGASSYSDLSPEADWTLKSDFSHSARSQAAEQQSAASAPIIMTNNHRVSGDYLPVGLLARAATSKSPTSALNGDNNDNNLAPTANNFTIKYSAAKVDEFPVGGQMVAPNEPLISAPVEFNQPAATAFRARSGRMRSIGTAAASTNNNNNNHLKNGNDHLVVISTDHERLKQQPPVTWSVTSRMGDTLQAAEAGDLSAEPSNETSSSQSPPPPINLANATLAQNITGYLLRWSLKTLTNLARKSLENLIINNNSTAATSSEGLDFGNLDVDETTATSDTSQRNNDNFFTTQRSPVAIRTTPGFSSRQPVTTTTTTRQPPVASSTRVPLDSTRRPQVTSSTTSATGSNQQQVTATSERPHEQTLDGFLMNGSGQQEATERSPALTSGTTNAPKQQVTTTTASAVSSSHKPTQHSRPSVYSKSLRESTSSTATPVPRQREPQQVSSSHAPSDHQLHSGDQRQLSNMSHENLWANRESFYSSWVFYGILLFVALATAIFLTFCLVSASGPLIRGSRSSGARLGPTSISHPVGQFTTRTGDLREASGQLVLGGSSDDDADSVGCQNGAFLHDATTSYKKYDYNRFENYPIGGNNGATSSKASPLLLAAGQTGDRKPAANTVASPVRGPATGQQSPSGGSYSTRSTSAGSTGPVSAFSDENDCKNNEFLYTEHVLINTGSSFGESYA